jgi:hypothetical protein
VVSPDGSAVEIGYQDAVRLVWATPYGMRVEIASNLPDAEVLAFAEGMAVGFTPLVPGYRPADFYASKGAVGVRASVMMTEDRTYGNEHFVKVLQQPDAIRLPVDGEPIRINGHEGTIRRGLAGTADVANDTFFGGEPITLLGGGGGGGGGSDSPPQLHPPTLDYADGIALEWAQDGVWVNLLTNLPEEEALRVAESMTPTIRGPMALQMPGLRWQNGLTLVEFDVSLIPVRQGGGLTVYSYWRADGPVTGDPILFMHLLDGAGSVVAQSDTPLAVFVGDGWSAGGEGFAEVTLIVSPETPAGLYWLQLGWLDPSSGERVALEDGNAAMTPYPILVVEEP